jgi:type IX secretion system PorP/SprF family membrane protein
MYAGCQDAFAQDPHFSQYFSSPLTFNPAFAGYFDGTQRFTVNARTQWANVGDTYTTGTVSFDTKIMKGKIADNDRWGIGIHALYDQSSGGVFKNSYVSFSTAFNKGLDAEGDQSIGIGIQATIAHNAVDFNKISFSNQFTGSGFDLYVPNGETISNQSITYIDLNAGILYNYKILGFHSLAETIIHWRGGILFMQAAVLMLVIIMIFL